MIKAAVISNGIAGLQKYFVSSDKVVYEFIEISENFNPEFEPYDLLIVPNGSDHIAMYRIKDKVAGFLESGKSLFCFDGWFTKWIPNNQWVMDNQKKTVNTRYKVKNDTYDLFKDVNLDLITFNHGISGWWACGYIEPSKNAEVLLEDTWERPIIVLDRKSKWYYGLNSKRSACRS